MCFPLPETAQFAPSFMRRLLSTYAMPGTELGVRDATMNRAGTRSWWRGGGRRWRTNSKKNASNSQPQGALKKTVVKANNEGVAGDSGWGGEGRRPSEESIHHTILELTRALTQHRCLLDLQEQRRQGIWGTCRSPLRSTRCQQRPIPKTGLKGPKERPLPVKPNLIKAGDAWLLKPWVDPSLGSLLAYLLVSSFLTQNHLTISRFIKDLLLTEECSQEAGSKALGPSDFLPTLEGPEPDPKKQAGSNQTDTDISDLPH